RWGNRPTSFQHSNPAHPLPLSCAGGERQRDRPADERDELAPSHVGHGASPRRYASALHRRPPPRTTSFRMETSRLLVDLAAQRRAGGWFARESALTTLITRDRPPDR